MKQNFPVKEFPLADNFSNVLETFFYDLVLLRAESALMTTLLLIVVANLASRLIAVGLAALLSFRVFSRCGNLVAAFAAGLLLTIACTHLIPEALATGIDVRSAGGVLLASFVVFLLLDCLLSGMGGHTHSVPRVRQIPVLLGGGTRIETDACCTRSGGAQVPVLLAGAACHSFVDGVLVAAAFSINAVSGWIVAAAVTAHELPQVIGQIVILMQAGIEKRRACLYVFLASMASVVGGAAGWALLSSLQWLIGYAMLVSAASFIFVVLAVLMPELMHPADGQTKKVPLGLLAAVLAGIAVSLAILEPLHEEAHRLTESSAVLEQMHSAAPDAAQEHAH